MGGQLSSDEFEKTDLLLHVEQLNVDCFSLSGPKQKKQNKKNKKKTNKVKLHFDVLQRRAQKCSKFKTHVCSH